MNVGFNTSQFDLDKIRRLIEKKIVEARNKVATRAYNHIATMSPYPLWSGAYMSSWNISAGYPNMTFNAPPEDIASSVNTYQKIQPVKLSDLDTSNPYANVYITNATHHAVMVEFDGTPRHSDPWMIAHHAASSSVSSFRFF